MIYEIKTKFKKYLPFFISKVDKMSFKSFKASNKEKRPKIQKLETFENVYLHVPTGTLYKKNYGIISQSKIGLGRLRRTGLINITKPEFKRVKKIEVGSTIYCNSAKSGFYHWLIECIPRAELLKDGIPVYLPPLDNLNKVILNFIYPDLNIKYENSKWLYFKKFELPLFYANPGKGYIPVNFRKRILSKMDCQLDINVLYISRSKAKKRRMLNENKLLEEIIINKKNKAINLELYSFEKQLEFINRSKIIIAPHGAGLSNIIAASEETTILEILPTSERPMDFYKCLSESIKINYHFMLIENQVGRHSDYRLTEIDINFIKNFISKTLGNYD
jgi:hypothetical protein